MGKQVLCQIEIVVLLIFWGGEVDTQRAGFTAKLGYVTPSAPYQSIGVQVAGNRHEQNSYFGLREYNIQHDSGYVSGTF